MIQGSVSGVSGGHSVSIVGRMNVTEGTGVVVERCSEEYSDIQPAANRKHIEMMRIWIEIRSEFMIR
jgi:hypothetical protein